jgi:hypothetical protein
MCLLDNLITIKYKTIFIPQLEGINEFGSGATDVELSRR